MRWLGWHRRPDRLAVLAYHRVGARTAAPYDPWVFTADPEQLDQQVRDLKRLARVVGLDEALAIAHGRERARGTAVLLTFDDGYRDNLDAAVPVLAAHGVQAVFFVVTGHLDGGAIPWWDQMAWMVKAAPPGRLAMTGADGPVAIALPDGDRADAVKAVLDLYKSRSTDAPSVFLRELQDACGVAPPPPPADLFLSWDDARRMQEAGMRIGSHTNTHAILARLDAERQAEEIAQSKSTLERTLGTAVDVLAYPVGGREDFGDAAMAAARAAGYRAAFSCYGGFNVARRMAPFDLRRIPVYWGARAEWLLGN